MADPIKDRRLRTIWNSNAVFVPSGYGVEQRDLLFRFVKDGWPVAQIAFSGLDGSMIKLNDLPIYPKMGDVWGSDGMVWHAKHFRADVVFCMQDVWTLNPQFLQQIPRWIPYIPIDQDPVPPNVLANLKYAYKIITFSQFGHDTLLKAGFTSKLILEGTDTEIFKPMDKAQCRAEFNIPQDKFIVGMVGANKENPPRKGWQQAIEAFKLFHDNHPESIFFFQTNQNSPGGFPIRQFADSLGLGKDIMFIDEYLGTFHTSSDVMVKLYNAWDILSHPSLTEGFGLCVIEAMASGLPVIVNNCTSMPEMINPGVTGEICEVGQKFFNNSLSYYSIASVPSLHEKMEKLFVTDRVKMGKAARDSVVAKYNIDTLVQKEWIPYMEEIQAEIYPKIDTLPEKK